MIAIVKYNGGNVQSVQNALKKVNVESVVTDEFDVIKNAEKVIFPGVGEASSTMKNLKEKKLDLLIPSLKQPVLGICLGMQLMCTHSEEGDTAGLGIFDVEVRKFPNEDIVPHMGWNSVSDTKSIMKEESFKDGDLYFVHSYYCEISEYTTATCDYILPFSAALQKDNFYGMQFHPEKSGNAGLLLLENFLKI
ncbi:imidazole glycerol phosphate synthase subunit HisH [Chryseobacterium sp. Leaf180]|uniref:imidazole glycerol phosphate synthase subunit HisH n=1 Tax=Chryseobacterium sp. Leaf180 TaxID=1736289 RepID=UPI000AD82EAF|nr:imidazole glycerol phosphate synthase subunit HisH [Chryseobacterium sp. Leaf180]